MSSAIGQPNESEAGGSDGKSDLALGESDG